MPGFVHQLGFSSRAILAASYGTLDPHHLSFLENPAGRRLLPPLKASGEVSWMLLGLNLWLSNLLYRRGLDVQFLSCKSRIRNGKLGRATRNEELGVMEGEVALGFDRWLGAA